MTTLLKKTLLPACHLHILRSINIIINTCICIAVFTCPFYLLTGLKCPGCGSQRATYYLLHFHFIEALKCNALMVISLPIVCILSYIELIRKRNPHLYAIAYKTKYIWAYLIIVIIWWICRNIFDL